MTLRPLLVSLLLCAAAPFAAQAQSQTADATAPATTDAGEAERAYERARDSFRRAAILESTDGAPKARLAAFADARSDYRIACAGGVAKGCMTLADMLRRGLGGPQDLSGAKQSYRSACSDGLAGACAGLASTLHREASRTGGSLDQAERYYSRACDLGSVEGCGGLGSLLYTGATGSFQRDRGASYLNDSCDRGYQWACDRIQALGVERNRGGGRERGSIF